MSLTVTDLRVWYGPIVAVQNLSLDLEGGDVVALLGPNGAGKSSVLEAIAGRVSSSGRVLVDGLDVVVMPTAERARRGLRLVPQSRELFLQLRVEDNLMLGCREGGRTRKRRVEDMLETFPLLGRRRNLRAALLSGGEQQILALARALIGDPAVLLLDEPSFGLAPSLRVEVVSSIVDECKARGLTVLLAEQFVDVSLAKADRVIVLENGESVWQGKANEITKQEIEQVYLSRQQ